MSDVQYPFIDVAVHERVSEAFAAGMAVVLFSPDLRSVSWANGRGAALFGFGSIYDFLDQGLDRGELMFRQVEPVARSLQSVGDRRTFTIRIASGFLRVAVQARCEMIRVQNKPCILLSVPVDNQHLSLKECAARLIEGFDDPETHMAVLDAEGNILAASGQFPALAISIQTGRMLVSMVGNDRHRLIKRPIATSGGYLPAAIGQVSEEPALNLLFVVGAAKAQGAAIAASHPATQAVEGAVANVVSADEADVVDAPDYDEALSAVAAIEDNPDLEEEISLEGTPELDAEDEIATDEAAAVAAMPFEPEAETETAQTDEIVAEAEIDVSEVAQAEEDIADDVIEPETAEPVFEALEADESELAEVSVEAPSEESATLQDVIEEDNAATDRQEIPAERDGYPAVERDDETVEDEILIEDQAAPAEIFTPVEMNEPEAAVASPNTEIDLAPALASEAVSAPVRRSGTVRFVWKIDESGRFSEVSREFAEAVGPHAADISGMAFADLAALFNLDPEGKIAELLGRRDTWSGKTIWWPVEGTSKVVPVDLAALPTYTRAREFDGFRGFGIVRMGDAVEDPHAAGLSFGRAQDDILAEPANIELDERQGDEPVVAEGLAELSAGEEVAEGDATATESISQADAETTGDNKVGNDDGDEPIDDLAAETDSAAHDDAPSVDGDDRRGDMPDDDAEVAEAEDQPNAADWPESEPPALTLADNPGRRQADKVIQLEERRSRLSAGEQANFQEIARRLDRFVKSTDRSQAERDEISGDEDDSVEMSASVTPDDDIPSRDKEFDRNEDLVPETDDVAGHSMSDDEDEPQEADEEQSEASLPAHEEDGLEMPHPAEADDAVVSLFDDRQAEASDEVLEDEAEEEADEPVDAAALVAMLPGRDRTGLSEEIIDQMPVALLVHAGDALIHANGEFLKLTGYSSLEALGDVGGLDALLQRQELEDKTTHAGGMVVVRADDVIVPVTARLQSIRFNDTTALMLALMPVVAEVEAPESTSAEVLPLRPLRSADQLARLQVEVEELRAILETATDGVVIIGSDREVRSMNRAASALFNFDGDEINGKPFVTLFAHESQRAILDYLSGLSGHGVASVLNDGREVIGREASGGFIPLFMTIGRLTSSNGYCAVIRDITQWKRTEDELRTAKRAAETANAHKSEFLAHVSHEIRTPLNAIIGFADMMASERLGPVGHPRYIEYSNDIGRSGRHVLDIVNDLLDISKIEAGELDLDFIAVGLNETVSEAVSLVQPQANGQRVIIRTALSQAVPQVVADLRSIKQIVLNILSNAIRFTPSGGQIVVSTAYEANGSVVLRIRDTGIGMTRPELELAMKPFRQVAGASRKRGDGTGLGLPLTKAMVDANRANFAITSAPNEGTLVEITFPSQRVLAS